MTFMWIFLVSLGEGLMIVAEATCARAAIGHLSVSSLVLPLTLVLISGLMLLAGYFIGMRTSGIWSVSVVSILSISVLEPPIVYLLFRTAPSGGAIAGFVLGVVGLLVSLM